MALSPDLRERFLAQRSPGPLVHREFRREAHLPAKQPPSFPQARVPGPNADPIGPRHHQLQAPSGPPEAVGLTGIGVAAGRLRSGRDIAAVFASREQRGGRLVGVHLRRRGGAGGARVAVVASRKVGGAVARNRAKRLLRVAAGSLELPPGADVVLVARAATASSCAAEVTQEAAGLLASLERAEASR